MGPLHGMAPLRSFLVRATVLGLTEPSLAHTDSVVQYTLGENDQPSSLSASELCTKVVQSA